MTKLSQEEIIATKIAKNYENKNGKVFQIGSTSKLMGGLNPEEFEKMREFGLKIAKEIGVKEETKVVKEIFEDEDFQKELGLESEFCNEFWYIRREFEIAEYFNTRGEIKKDLLELMVEGLKEGIKDSFKEGKVYKMDVTVSDLEEFIVDLKELKEELGL